MLAERPNWAPENIDLDRPNAARIYDYFLGGACNFEQDRVFANRLLEVAPLAEAAARFNRAFLRRAVRFCVSNGIRQFLDLGSGIPTAGNVHEIAQELAPESRVLHVDSDPVAVAHSELMLADNENAAILQADLTDVDAVLRSASARRLLSFDEPMALLMVAVLHYVPDEANPRAVVARYVDAMASGSFLVLSHGTGEGLEESAEDVGTMYNRVSAPGFDRTPPEIEELFAATTLVEPGLVWTPQWRPDRRKEVGEHPERSMALAGVGRKP